MEINVFSVGRISTDYLYKSEPIVLHITFGYNQGMTDDTSLTTPEKPYQPLLPADLHATARAANQAAAQHAFADYRQRRARNTLRRQDSDLALFTEFLNALNLQTGSLAADPQAWRGITWGLVETFVKWQLKEGYAVTSVNVRLSTVKTYARLAMQAGSLDPQEYALIRSVRGYSRREQHRIDRARPRQRVGMKKSSPALLTPEQASALKEQPDTPQGRRDRLMMCLLLDHGLRVGELAGLKSDELDLAAGVLRFYRPKVGKVQVHRLSPDALEAARAYASLGDMLPHTALLRTSRKDGSLGKAGMSERALTRRVNFLALQVGIANLSAHDCRHHWATSAARHGTDPFRLQEAGGWSSLAMPRRYVEENRVANDGVRLEEQPGADDLR